MHYLPEESSVLQTRIKEIKKFCDVQQMVINESKSKTAIFNSAIKKDFDPRLKYGEQKFDNVEEFELLGVKIVSHQKYGIKWDSYISECIQRGYTNLWVLKRLVELGAKFEDVLMTYCQRVRVHVEINTPLWTFSISQKLSDKIEKLQKSAVYIMLPLLGKHTNLHYNNIIEIMGLDLLKERRLLLSDEFVRKMFKHPEHRKMFTLCEGRTTRAGRKVIVPQGKTRRYQNSSIPSLAELLNSQS